MQESSRKLDSKYSVALLIHLATSDATMKTSKETQWHTSEEKVGRKTRSFPVVPHFELLRVAGNPPEPENGFMDVNTLAKHIVDQVIGEKLKNVPPSKNAEMAARGRMGGLAGGKA